ncbi:hypothetical protein [Anaerotignum sp.]|uniref:hypothetical protein n=1 Tax=Anaerotignum sp. TaxID=2039241 RepID=UPI0028AB028F|nr:hypothetical protein [Anaerotignum sp.]
MKKHLKRGWVAACCLGLALAFSGCGNSGDAPAEQPVQEQPAEQPAEEPVQEDAADQAAEEPVQEGAAGQTEQDGAATDAPAGADAAAEGSETAPVNN